MYVIVKHDLIVIRPLPKKDIQNGIKMFVPKRESNLYTGVVFGDIFKGQGDYQLPEDITADDIADIQVESSPSFLEALGL